MITRSRPKFYVSPKNCGNTLPDVENLERLYFNSGRSALKFLLRCYVQFFELRPKIVMQSFNCRVVADAAIEAGCDIYLVDIDLNFFSMSYESLSCNDFKFDILLLTHYQGIPNFDYGKIVHYCQNNGVFLIEDMAQTFGSTVDGIEVGSLGDVAIFSYAFDKPFSAGSGGSLEFNACSPFFKDFITSQFQNLPTESDKKSSLDLKALNFMFVHTDPNLYTESIQNRDLINFLILLKLNKSAIYKFCLLLDNNSVLKKLISLLIRLFRLSNPYIKYTKMHKNKIIAIIEQENRFECDASLYFNTLALKHGLDLIKNPKARICWNRYSVLDPQQSLKSFLVDAGVECGNFNWKYPLHFLFNGHSTFTMLESLQSSEYASRNILNIPTWHRDFNGTV